MKKDKENLDVFGKALLEAIKNPEKLDDAILAVGEYSLAADIYAELLAPLGW